MASPIPVLPLVASSHGLARLQRAPALGILDHAEGEPVLHGAHRIERLDLDVQIDARGCELGDLDLRRVADGLENVRELGHGSQPLGENRERAGPCRRRAVACPANLRAGRGARQPTRPATRRSALRQAPLSRRGPVAGALRSLAFRYPPRPRSTSDRIAKGAAWPFSPETPSVRGGAR